MALLTIRYTADIEKVIIHHTATARQIKGKDLNQQAIYNSQFGLPYDVVINTDGTVDITARWTYSVAPELYNADIAIPRIFTYTIHHLSGAGETDDLNKKAMHIAVVGNFGFEAPTSQQLASLMALLTQIRTVLPDALVVYHSDVAASTCPGAKFFERSLIGVDDTQSANYGRTDFKLLSPERVTETFTQVGELATTQGLQVTWIPPPPSGIQYPDYLYAASTGVLSVIDVRIPSAPVEAAAFSGGAYSVIGAGLAVFHYEDAQYIYMGFKNNNLVIFEKSNPLHPTVVNSSAVTGCFSNGIFFPTTPLKTFVIVSGGGGIITSWNMTNPASPTNISTINLSEGGGVNNLAYEKLTKRLFWTTGNNLSRKWVGIVDFDPVTGVLSGPFKSDYYFPNAFGFGGSPAFMYFDAVVAKWRFYAYDVDANFGNHWLGFDTTSLGNHANDFNTFTPNNIMPRKGNTILLGTGTGPYSLYDMTTLTTISTLGTAGAATGAPWFQGKYVYLRDVASARLSIFDISNQASPVLIGTTPPLSTAPVNVTGYPNDFGWYESYSGDAVLDP